MLKVIFQDSSLLVIEKPAGLVSTRSETQQEATLEDMLAQEFKLDIERAGIVHRLDKDTSGVMVVAKTPEALENLQAQFKERVTGKEYLALVHGWLEKGGVVDLPIGRNPEDREKFTVFPKSVLSSGQVNAKEAVTQYQPQEKLLLPQAKIDELFSEFNTIQNRKLKRMAYDRFTLVWCHPLTGRTHQIRVHLKYLGFPIVGDARYGGRKVVRLDHRFCQRQFLHAAKLEFNHPVSGERLKFESPLPEDLQNVLNLLEPVPS